MSDRLHEDDDFKPRWHEWLVIGAALLALWISGRRHRWNNGVLRKHHGKV
jgi:hypothetical protein